MKKVISMFTIEYVNKDGDTIESTACLSQSTVQDNGELTTHALVREYFNALKIDPNAKLAFNGQCNEHKKK